MNNDFNAIVDRLTPFVATIPDITAESMAEAKRKAKEAIIAEYTKPVRTTDSGGVSKYPPIVVKYTTIALILLFITSFIPSAIHIYTAVIEEQSHVTYMPKGMLNVMPMVSHVSDAMLTIIAICAVFGAELAIMVMVIGSEVFFDDKKKMKQWFYMPIGLALGIAYVGNWVAVKPDSPFDFLLMVAFPTFTLFISFIGKMLILDIVQGRFDGERKHQEALADYKAKTTNPELAPNFLNVYNRQLIEYIKPTINTGAGASERKRIIASLSAEEKQVLWTMLVNRTMDMENQEFIRMIVPSEARSSSVTISTHRAKLPSMTNGGVVPNSISIPNVPNFSKMEENGNGNTGIVRQTPKTQRVINYFKANPDAINLTCTELEDVIGVGKSTINNVQNAIRKGNISLE